jgi:hypothetical protein
MKGLTLDDLLPLEEFALKRRELFDAHGRYLDRYRRVRIGPRAALLFENRQTLWFRVQEVLRVARLVEPGRVQRELALYNRLLPGRDRLQAALIVSSFAGASGLWGAVADEARLAEDLAVWQELRGEHLCLHVGPARFPANLLTCRPEDRCAGTAHWVQFVLDAAGRRLLADFHQPAHFAVHLASYRHDSPPLGDEVRQSLLDDLQLSDRDSA